MNLVELAANGGKVQTFGKPLFELTGRQMRFLFATGAFKAGRDAARAVAKPVVAGYSAGSLVQLGRSGSGGYKTTRPIIRAAAKQAMKQKLSSYTAMKRAAIISTKFANPNASPATLRFARSLTRSLSANRTQPGLPFPLRGR